MLGLLPINALFFGISLGLWLYITQSQLENQMRLQADSLAQQLDTLSRRALASHNEWLLPSHVMAFSRLSGVREVTVLTWDGRVLADSQLERVGRTWDHPPPATKSLVSQPSAEVRLVLQSRSEEVNQECLQVALACGFLLGAVGLLVVARSAHAFSLPILRVAEKAQIYSETWPPPLPLSLDGTPAQSEVGALSRALDQMALRLRDVALRQRHRRLDLERRVQTLLSCVQRVTRGELTVRCTSEDDDAIGRLEKGFNAMLVRLVKTRQAELQARLDLEWTREALVQGNRRLAELDRRKTDFLNTASHELRTPLTSIRAFAEIVLDNCEQDSGAEFLEENREFLDIISRESERLARLLASLLDLNCIETGKVEWTFEDLSVGDLVQATVTSCQSLLREKQQELRVDVPSEIHLRGARDPLIQVLTNLLSNAHKFTPLSEGKIEIRARQNGDQVIVEVEDNGVGIAVEDQHKVFESFQQAEEPPTPSYSKGSGLGLAIVKQIVESHGGSIKVQSQLGKGSCFSVRLPVS
jgi:signal transduction histidine kinase